MDLKMQSGTSEMIESNFQQIVINEKLANLLKNLDPSSNNQDIVHFEKDQAQVVGVIKNYNHEPLNQRIEPMILKLDPSRLTYAFLTTKSDDIGKTLSGLESKWNKLYPDTPFTSSFLEDEVEKAYDFFIVGIKIFGFLAVLAVTISSLGLLGMVIYYTENRTKEVAMRKILGANGKYLVFSLSGLFFKLWGIAILLALPVSFFFYDKLLVGIYNKFSDGVGFSELLICTLATVGLGMLAILWQTGKVMKVNPVIHLRNE